MRGVFHLKTDEERQERQTKAAWKQYQASPAGQAAAAFKRGDAFFQIDIAPTSMSPWADFYKTWDRRPHVPTDVLGQIEAAGWRLEHASWVSDTSDKVTGIYLFRRRSQWHADGIPLRELEHDPARSSSNQKTNSAKPQADHVATHTTAPKARDQRDQGDDGCATGSHAAASRDSQTISS